MIRLTVERIPKLKSKIENRFALKAESVLNLDPYGFGELLYVIVFYLSASPKVPKPIKYFNFLRSSRRIELGEYSKIDDPTTKESHMLTKNFNIETLLTKLRELIFTDKTLSNRVFFLTKKQFLEFSINLLDLIDEETAKNLEKAKRFILSHKFLYLLS